MANYRRDVVRKIDPWFFVETQREANCIVQLDTACSCWARSYVIDLVLRGDDM